MKRRRLLVLASVTGAMLVLAAWATLWRDADLQREHTPERVFPELIDHVNKVAEIAVESPQETFRIERTEEGWVIPNLADYPVDSDRPKKLLVTLSILETLEPKTSDPDRHASLGLSDPTAPENGATSVTLRNRNGDEFASLLVGRDASGTRETRYVRRVGEDQTWLVWRNFDLPQAAVGWLDSSVLQIARWRVRRIAIEHTDGEVVTVARESYDEQHFGLQDIPEGFEPTNPFVGNQLGSVLERVSMVTIKNRDEVPFLENAPVTKIETFDGLRLEVTTAEVDNLDWMKVDAFYDPSVRKELPEDGPNIVGLPEMPSLEDVEKEANALSERLGRWVFAIAPAKRKQLSQRMADLIKEKEVPTEKGEDGNDG